MKGCTIIISFDGLSTIDFDSMGSYENFSEFLKEASYCKNVYSIYPSLTYPAHATIVTGKYPRSHGVINNTLFQLNRTSPDWYWSRDYIKGDTLYDAAIRKGMTVAALLWPVTAKSKIQYNMPEIFANRPWQNQIIVSLLNGSPLYQYELNRKLGHLRNGLKQPNLDNFTHESLLHTIKHKNPDLIFAHYTDLDTMRHHNGYSSDEANQALVRHDKRLGEIIKLLKDNGIYEDSRIIILGDHSSLDEDKVINLNVLLKNKGYITVDSKGKVTGYKAIVKNCDGSAYIYLNDNNDTNLLNEIKELLENFNGHHQCIEAIYSKEEAETLGADSKCSLMLEAALGYYFLDDYEGEIIKEIQAHEPGVVEGITRATHGYSPFKDNYTTVFMASGKGIKKGAVVEKMSLVDEAPTLAELMELKLDDVDGRIIGEFLC